MSFIIGCVALRSFDTLYVAALSLQWVYQQEED